ncbi:BQ5605_C024g09821 [Microbotryum silenes-dioicae]|uniref:BQ5605_C024g09821 protein n=1 Tax=Microbotryum silenes-dioicae TaxID=796604 RepID=A0A2X0PL79_9BASI|nr:BQ5605_C024g09821 [Microbotryum silenes-dioicae]
MDFCICLQIGCSNRLSQEGDGQSRVCPRCHNAAVVQVKSTKCLEICCVPLVPLGSDHLWHCSICQWQIDQSAPPPPLPQQGWAPPQQQQGYAPQEQMQFQQPGYEQQQQHYPK